MTVLQRSGPTTSLPQSQATGSSAAAEHDLISTASSALRRLHFKSAGASRINKARYQSPQQQVPKVVIMGSSTTSTSSNNTINTSTDSANTVTTMVTATDDADTDTESTPRQRGPAVSTGDSVDEMLSLDKDDDAPQSESSGTDESHRQPAPPPPTPLLGAAVRREPRFVFIKTEAGTDEDEEINIDEEEMLALLDKATRADAPPPGNARPHRRHSSRRRSRHSSRSSTCSSSSTATAGGGGSTRQPRRPRPDAAAPPPQPPPDLRVDFFPEDQEPKEGRDDAAGGSGGGGAASSPAAINTAGAGPTVNTTANPLVGLTSCRHHPKQSVVVQQQGSPAVATVLLKNCSPCVQLTSQQEASRREENMKQLLDVANTLTLQELHDFEMRYGSPHHNRSQSVKTPGSRSNPSGRPNYLCLPQQRSRVASMPNTGVEEEYYRLRHFSITGKGVVNRGDSLKSRRSKSNNSVTSSNSSHSTEHVTTAIGGGGGGGGGGVASYPGSARTSATASLASSRESSTSNPGPVPYRVVMLGAAGVGKSSLISQFMTSEYLHAYDTSLDDEFGEKSVSVLLDGEESELTFIDHPCGEMSPENCIITYEPHAYCVVYSTVDRSSLRVAEETLQYLWKTDSVSSKAVILVANKTDLVRCRTVTTEEGKSMATSYDCKFIETSVGINHNVDELLVGLLTQIRLKLENPERARDLFRKRSCSRKKGGGRSMSPLDGANSGHKPYRGSRTSTSLKVKSLLGKVWARDSKSKSCENLHVL